MTQNSQQDQSVLAEKWFERALKGVPGWYRGLIYSVICLMVLLMAFGMAFQINIGGIIQDRFTSSDKNDQSVLVLLREQKTLINTMTKRLYAFEAQIEQVKGLKNTVSRLEGVVEVLLGQTQQLQQVPALLNDFNTVKNRQEVMVHWVCNKTRTGPELSICPK